MARVEFFLVVLLCQVACSSHWPGVISDGGDTGDGDDGGDPSTLSPLESSKDDGPSKDELLHEVLQDLHPLTTQRELDLEDFLWSGSGDSDIDDYVDPSYVDLAGTSAPGYDATPSGTVVVSTIFTTVFPSHTRRPGDPSRITHHGLVDPTPVLPRPSGPSGLVSPAPGLKLPEEQFLIRTVVMSNMTVIHNGIENFKVDMEDKLTRAYRHAYSVGVAGKRRRRRRGLGRIGRVIRSSSSDDEEDEEEDSLPTVRIHNIRSSLPEPEIEMIYTVAKDGDLVPADEAVSVLCSVDDGEVSGVLGFPLITKAEPYTSAGPGGPDGSSGPDVSEGRTSWLVAAVVFTSLLALVILLALLFLVHRYKSEELKHRRLLGSPGPGSSQEGGSQADSSIDQAAFALGSPSAAKPGIGVSKQQQQQQPADQPVNGYHDAKKGHQLKPKRELHSSGEDLFRPSSKLSSSLLDEESPSLADLSSNNTPETKHKTRRGHRKRSTGTKPKSSNKRIGTPGTEVDQSVFPVRTPDKEGWIGPLSDLLEEEITLPGESRQHSAESGGRKNWPYLPERSSPSTSSTSSSSSDVTSEVGEEATWEQRVEQALGEGVAACAAAAKEAADDEDAGETASKTVSPDSAAAAAKKRAVSSAKSHIFRKGKVDAARPAAMHSAATTRPWSAHESRLQADPIFAMRRRHWEGLVSGKKRLHRGQLLPGSTSEEELKEHVNQQLGKRSTGQQPKACWSECTSPRKQVRIQDPPISHAHSPPSSTPTSSGSGDPTGPIIAAIREELQKFQRDNNKPNLAGITVINDPALVNEDGGENDDGGGGGGADDVGGKNKNESEA